MIYKFCFRGAVAILKVKLGSQENPSNREEKRLHNKKILAAWQAKKQKERNDFRSQFRASNLEMEAIAESERKEFEKFLKAAIASRAAFDAYEHEMVRKSGQG